MTSTSSPPPGGSFAAFRYRGYLVFWLGAFISSTGTWLGNLTVPYVLYQETGSAVWVGLASAALFGPAFLLSPLGGTLADTVDRRQLLMWTQGAMGLVAAALWILWVLGLREPLLMIVLVAVLGTLNGLNNPAWQSLVNDLVAREHVLSAVTLNSLQFNLARALGPALSGVLLATLGASWAFFLNAVSFAIVVIALVFVRQHRPGGTGRRERQGFLSQWRDAGLHMVSSPSMILAIVLCCLVGFLGNPIFTLTVVFAEDVFRTDAVGMGLLTASLGVGAVLYALAGLVPRRRSVTFARRITGSMTALGMSLLALSVAPGFTLAAVFAMGVGAAFLAAFAALNSVIQLMAPDHLRGRILAVRHMVYSASLALGVLVSGIVTEAWGVQRATAALGLGLVLAVVVLAVLPFLAPRLPSMDRFDQSGS